MPEPHDLTRGDGERPRLADGSSEARVSRSVSLDEAAQRLHVSRRTVYNRIREGRLETIRTPGGSQRVLLTSLSRWVA
ncbi:MAG: helix-turn-helix domain-containing protein [Acidobacteriota bacterium]